MTNNTIVISRIQNRRGRRENLPQPLLPGEIALTADTGQTWIGGDPELSAPAIRVYQDKNISNAQSIIDVNIVEAIFDDTFTLANFNTLVLDLVADNTITLVPGDVLYDSTFRGEILSVSIDAGGSGYNIGDGITAISATGSGFIGEVASVSSGAITSITINSGGQNYTVANTTFAVAGGSGASLSVSTGDIHGTTVHIAARTGVDPNNTIANIGTALTNITPAVASKLISSGAFQGTIDTGTGVLSVNNQVEAANLSTLINRVNADTPGEVTGLVSTNLNIEITGSAGALAVTAADIDSEAATSGQVLTADGAGGASFEDAAAGSSVADGTVDGDMLYWDETGTQTYLSTSDLQWLDATQQLKLGVAGFVGDNSGILEIQNGSGDTRMAFTETDGGVIIIEQDALRISGDAASGGGRLALFGVSGGRAEISTNASDQLNFGQDGTAIVGATFTYPVGINGNDPASLIGAVTLFTQNLSGATSLYGRNSDNFRYPALNYHQVAYRFNNPTAAADPGPGFFRVNTADFSTATEMYFDDQDFANNPDAAFFFNSLSVGDLLHVVQGSDPNRWLLCTIDSVTDNGGWYTVVFTTENSNGTVFINGEPVQIEVEHFSLAAGGGGAQISGTPSNNQLAVWTNSTTIEGESELTYSSSELELAAGQAQITLDETDGGGGCAVFLTSTTTGNGGGMLFHDSSTGGNIRLQQTSTSGTPEDIWINMIRNGTVEISFNGTVKLATTTDGVLFTDSIYMDEKAAASADVTGDGQYWVRNDSPNTPMFTDDAGNDFILKTVTSTTTELEDIASNINTDPAKTAGFAVFNTTTNVPVWAVGDTAGSVWVDATGTTAHTPI